MQKKNKPSRRDFIQKAALAPIALSLPLGRLQPAESSETPIDAADCFGTTLDYYGQGPFYTANAPTLADNALAPENEPGTKLVISGIVRTLDCTEVIPEAIIDIWHADHNGAYDTQGYHLRGKITSNAQGFYLFETIQPGKYLNGASCRPSHIHLKITPPGFPTLTTQLYFEGDSDIPGDAAASITNGQYDASHRIIPLADNGQGILEGTWDIILDGDGTTGVADLHLDKGIIYSAAPNPCVDHLEIFYGVFKNAHVRVDVFNQIGARVARLVDEDLSPQKYTVVWNDIQSLPAGHYWVTIKINGLQVHYVKVVKV
jgi:protocatechuate 3,4-dioxygenase beta subunit